MNMLLLLYPQFKFALGDGASNAFFERSVYLYVPKSNFQTSFVNVFSSYPPIMNKSRPLLVIQAPCFGFGYKAPLTVIGFQTFVVTLY